MRYARLHDEEAPAALPSSSTVAALVREQACSCRRLRRLDGRRFNGSALTGGVGVDLEL